MHTMQMNEFIIRVVVSLFASIVISYVMTPVVMRFARKIGAVDVPMDNRRMHKRPVLLLGGLSIITSFLIASLIVLWGNDTLMKILPGAIIIAVLGIIDDKHPLPAWPKFLVQCIAASIAVAQGVSIDHISGIQLFGIKVINLGVLDIPLTIIWIVGLTNAVNFIDGLDGLADGVSIIAALSMCAIAVLRGRPEIAILSAALAGGCIGLLPYNRNPAKIFMGDTGATFLGFTLSILSIQGLFKYYAAISFAVPFMILGLPIMDAFIAIVRRVSHGKSPFSSDRAHIHHKMIDMGLSQKQTVATLYSVSIVMGIIAVVCSVSGSKLSWLLFLIGVVVVFGIFVFVAALGQKNRRSAPPQQPSGVKIPREKVKTPEQK